MVKNGFAVRVLLAASLLAGCCVVDRNASAQMASAPAAKTDGPLGLLTHEQAEAILPASVFYRGQSATIQGRNSAGIRLNGGRLVLAAIVDTGGYSTAVQQTYQAYLLTEVALKLGDKTLAPGAYGFGFVAGDRMVIMDVGANEILEAKTTRDAALARPKPLQLIADETATGSYKLYLGRSFVELTPQAK